VPRHEQQGAEAPCCPSDLLLAALLAAAALTFEVDGGHLCIRYDNAARVLQVSEL
jgi:hypothetical protein